MKKRPFHDPDDRPGGGAAVSPQTAEDLAIVEAAWRRIVEAQADMLGALARVDGRGDGPAAVGMPMEQWLRWQTNQHGAVISGIGSLLDVWNDVPTVRAALTSGKVCLDQAIAAARELARVGRALRVEVDAALADQPGWTGWAPDLLTANVCRLLDELRPVEAMEREERAAGQQWLAIQPHLDGQGFRYWGDAYGADAALFEASVNRASDAPKAGVPRARQRAQGLNRILRDWSTGQHNQPARDDDTDDAHTDGDAGVGPHPGVMIHLLVEEGHQSDGHAATVLSKTREFAPRLTARALAELTDDSPHVKTITTFTRDGVPVSVKGRAGHAIDDPEALSEDTTRELVRLRQGVCAAPGCSNPINDYHHIIWRVRGGTDDPSNRAGLCPRCHHRIVHGHDWSITVNPDGSTTWTLGGRTVTVPARHQRILRRAARHPPDGAPDPDDPELDDDGDPLPF